VFVWNGTDGASRAEVLQTVRRNKLLKQFPLMTRRRFLAQAGLAAMALRAGSALSPASGLTTRLSTPCGRLIGLQADGVLTFRSIPFAEPPTGPLRFLPPRRLRQWQGELDATRFAAAAMQAGGHDLARSEDCLYLNISAPQGKGPFPVLVWIHGGGFLGGHSSDPLTNGAVMAKQGVVCVTVAYRLGIFGFLDMEPLLGEQYRGSANNGLRDLMAALEWVQENIAAFGGDPSRVTIGGESAGAKLIGILMGIPAAKPLFHQMISQSGGAERIWSRSHGAEVALGFEKSWRELGKVDPRSAPATELIRVQGDFIANWPEHFPLRPAIDGILLSKLPVATIANGSTRGKRLLIGTMRDESAFFIGPHPQRPVSAGDLGNLTLESFGKVFDHYRALYPEASDELLRIRSLTAEEYWLPSMRTVQAHEKGGGNSWVYRLDFSESSGPFRGCAYHSMDVRLVWNKPSLTVANAAEEAAMSQQIYQAWLGFLHGKVPASPGLPTWPEFHGDTRPTMILDGKSHVELRPQEEELRLWDGVL